MSWEVVKTVGRGRSRNPKPPSVTWNTIGKFRPAYLSVAALDIAQEVVGKGKDIGVTVHLGTKDDKGKFALAFVEWKPDTHDVVKLCLHKSGATFSAGAISMVAPAGQDVGLERIGDMLVGTVPASEQQGVAA